MISYARTGNCKWRGSALRFVYARDKGLCTARSYTYQAVARWCGCGQTYGLTSPWYTWLTLPNSLCKCIAPPKQDQSYPIVKMGWKIGSKFFLFAWAVFPRPKEVAMRISVVAWFQWVVCAAICALEKNRDTLRELGGALMLTFFSCWLRYVSLELGFESQSSRLFGFGRWMKLKSMGSWNTPFEPAWQIPHTVLGLGFCPELQLLYHWWSPLESSMMKARWGVEWQFFEVLHVPQWKSVMVVLPK